ncbi:MAG: hypothetical protein KJ666_14460 [Bacteroidetes bacterium]|nr:hypothetical protein [Bacteroidota bacterium]
MSLLKKGSISDFLRQLTDGVKKEIRSFLPANLSLMRQAGWTFPKESFG